MPPAGDGPLAGCVANAPGGPIHVLRTDREADHLPGANLSVRRSCLVEAGGFDPRFRVAGDDVDLCWRLQERGWTLGFHPAAVVWHHRRNSVGAYWRQQIGYGQAEALLEAKWPERYNAAGHFAWTGRLYGGGPTAAIAARRGRVYQGIWGSAPFQSLYAPAPGLLAALPLMPEWILVVAVLAALAALGLSWTPLLVALPLLAAAVAWPLAQAALGAARATFPTPPATRRDAVKLRALTMALHLLQPLARLWGRLRHGLTPWRRRGPQALALPVPRAFAVWTAQWRSQDDRLRSLLDSLRADGAVVRVGGEFDHWDLEIRGGLLAAARALQAIEEHGGGKQLVRFRCWPRFSPAGLAVTLVVALLAAGAAADAAWPAAVVLGAAVVVVLGRALWEAATAIGAIHRARERAGIGGGP